MTQDIYVNTIAFMEKPQAWSSPVATFANEELYSLCAPIIEQWIAKRNPNYVLSESCEINKVIALLEEQTGEDFCQACEDGTCSELTTAEEQM